MTTRPPTRKMPLKDRRSASDAKVPGGSLQHLKGLLGRPIGLQRKDGQVRVVLVERRRSPPANQAPSQSQLCDELRALVLSQEATATQTMRHLVRVHDALETSGWPGVQALPGPILRRALVQAEMLASVEPSPALEVIIERLRPLMDAVDQREESASRLQDFRVGESLEVSESTFAEFETLERSWIGTVPSRLSGSGRDD